MMNTPKKHCFEYCGPKLCDCGREEDPFDMVVPAEPGVEYEWKGISECLDANIDIAQMFEEGWEFVGGALRRPKGWTKP